MIFLDANIFMYAVGTDSPYRAPCLKILGAVATGTLSAATNTEVLQEILYRYIRAGDRALALERARQARSVVGTVLPVEDPDLMLAISLLQDHPTLGVRDAIHAASARRWKCEAVVSADRGFDVLDPAVLRRADPVGYAAVLP